MVWGMQADGPCCESRLEAASKGHYKCDTFLHPRNKYYFGTVDLYPALSLALRWGHLGFARSLFDDYRVRVFNFAKDCVYKQDAKSLQWALGMALGTEMDMHARYGYRMYLSPSELEDLSALAGRKCYVDCLRVLLENGAPCVPYSLYEAARLNRLDILDVLVRLSRWEPHPILAGVAACAGNVRFLMRISEAGWPLWFGARDGEPALSQCTWFYPDQPPSRYPVGHLLEDWSLVVSSDLVRSGPVLLYAAQKGAPLTPRMRELLGEVRRRARALAGCFHRAARLSRSPGPAARKWGAMGNVPVVVIERIATLGKLSNVVLDLVE
jgi:hypothetical protein